MQRLSQFNFSNLLIGFFKYSQIENTAAWNPYKQNDSINFVAVHMHPIPLLGALLSSMPYGLNNLLVSKEEPYSWASQASANGKEPTEQYRQHKRCGLDSWMGKIPWRRGMLLNSSILGWRIP